MLTESVPKHGVSLLNPPAVSLPNRKRTAFSRKGLPSVACPNPTQCIRDSGFWRSPRDGGG